jgi:protocatechuate 3,4-dioxygenase beta subunit
VALEEQRLDRARLVRLGLAVPLGLAAVPLVDGEPVLAATPACVDDDDLTPEQTEGPYFTPDSPLRHSLVTAGLPGTRLTITGQVLTTRCRPVPRALLDFWQADARGVYDNSGNRLRGHQLTDAAGRFRLTTIVPGLYSGRTRHIHVKAQAPGGSVLTTQLYFPREPRNRGDGIYDAALLLRSLRRERGGWKAAFDFVLDA